MSILYVILYACFVLGVTLFLLVLINRFVSAHERIASALEKAAAGPRRADKDEGQTIR